MIRTLLVSSLLLAVVLACAPHSPSQPPAPRPECKPALTVWTKATCTADATLPKLTCDDPKKTDTFEFTCNDGTTPVVLGTPAKKTQLKSITCGKDGWEFTGTDGKPIAAADYDTALGKDRQFSCGK